MRRILAAATAGTATLALAGIALAQTAEHAFGVWLNTANKATIEVYRCGDSLCGKLLKVADGQKTDSKNPDPAKRSRPIEGLVFMNRFNRDGAGKWSGKSYNRADGKSYPATLVVKSENALDLVTCLPPDRCATFKLVREGAAAPASAQQCIGASTTRTGPNGKTLTLCLDGKYSTCIRDSRRLGWNAAQAKAGCDEKKRQGLVR